MAIVEPRRWEQKKRPAEQAVPEDAPGVPDESDSIAGSPPAPAKKRRGLPPLAIFGLAGLLIGGGIVGTGYLVLTRSPDVQEMTTDDSSTGDAKPNDALDPLKNPEPQVSDKDHTEKAERAKPRVIPGHVLEPLAHIVKYWEEGENHVNEINTAARNIVDFERLRVAEAVADARGHIVEELNLAIEKRRLVSKRLEKICELAAENAEGVIELLELEKEHYTAKDATVISRIIDLVSKIPPDEYSMKAEIDLFLEKQFPTNEIVPQVLAEHGSKNK